MNNYRHSRAQISLKKLEENFHQLKAMTDQGRFFCPMVKADAYGHGANHIVPFLEDLGVSNFGFALVEEAVALRKRGSRSELLVFGPLTRECVTAIQDNQLTPVLSRLQDVELLGESQKSLRVHLKFNTGMGRLGFNSDEIPRLKASLSKAKFLEVTGLCTHLFHGEDLGDSQGTAQKQLATFEKIVSEMRGASVVHVFNSSGLISAWSHQDQRLVSYGSRPGIALYGFCPEILKLNSIAKEKMSSLALRPIMEVYSELVEVRRVKKGESVSYDAQWIAERDSRVGVVSLGYADGYSRLFSDRGQMKIGGQMFPVIGRVTMDYTMLDLTDAEGSLKTGAEVLVMGDQVGLDARDLATSIGVHEYEMVTRIGPRVPRVFLRD